MSSEANLTQPDAEQLYAALLLALKTDIDPERVRLVGIHSGGVWIAQRVQRDLGLKDAIGSLDISFYRDDFDRIGLHPQVKPTEIPFEVEGASIVLVDDVLYTGRTIRGAMNVLFDYGRPASIHLAVLLERSGRELPIAARWAGARIEESLSPGLQYVLAQNTVGQFSLNVETSSNDQS